MGIAQYEPEKLFNDVASALPTIEDTEQFLDNSIEWHTERIPEWNFSQPM